MSKPNTTQPINIEKIAKGAEVIRAITNDVRLKIVNCINEEKIINVNAIYRKLDLEQSVTSVHLKILKNAGIVNTMKEGKKIYYSLNKKNIDKIHDAIDMLLV